MITTPVRVTWLIVLGLTLGSLLGCSNSSGSTPAPAAPSILSFVASPTTITTGSSASLTGVFANGTGVITPGNLAATNGAPVSVTPSQTTTYTLTASNSAGIAVSQSATVTVQPVSSASVIALGVNLSEVNDWEPTQMFADAMKQARKFGSAASPYDESASVDEFGWPTQDAGIAIILNNQGAWTAGTYALSFTGQATVKSWSDANVSVGAVAYNSATNTSTGEVQVGPAYANIYLVFTNTQRTPASATGTGVTNISLMRPTKTGTPHLPGTLFTDRFLDRLKYFSALRLMEYLKTNNSTEAAWSDRSIPAYASQQEVPPHASGNINPQYVTGACYEYAIQLANQAGKDLWLNIPHLAFGGTYQFPSTIWATNLALLLRYGSDVNGNPYTGVNGTVGTNPQPVSGPVNPPLNPGLHVYLEYSNEYWSGVGNQSNWISTQANAAISANDPDLDWDHDTDMYDIEWRINAKGVMLIANAFAQVYGPSGFGSVYRPIYAGQIANYGTYWGLDYLDSQHGGASQYVWAVAGAPYVDFVGDAPGNTLTAAQIISGMQAYQAADIVPWTDYLASTAKKYNLEGGMVAYEGGQGANYATSGAIAAQTDAGIRGVTTADFDSWFGQNGGTFFYYNLCSGGTFGLSSDISYDIDADDGYSSNPGASTEGRPKWGGIKQVATTGQ